MLDKTNDQKMKFYADQSLHFPADALNGLDSGEVEIQREMYGANSIGKIRKDTVLFRLRKSFVNPFSIVLMVLAVISAIVDFLPVGNSAGNYTTVIIILVMLFISGCVRFTQEMKAKNITDSLLNFVNASVKVKRDGQWTKVESGRLVRGDAVRIGAGERVPADIRILNARDCFVSESAITGESQVQEKQAENQNRCPKQISECINIAFCGTTVVNGWLEGVVIAVGKNTLYGEIAPGTASGKHGYDEGAYSIAWVLIRFMAVLVPVVFIVGGLTKGNWVSAFLFALSVSVGLTPELLPMVITACLARGSFNMSQKKTVVKNVNAMQNLGHMDIICIDKTGTLTQDALLLEYYMDILGNEDRRVLDCVYLNSYYHSGTFNHLDSAILKIRDMPNMDKHLKVLTDMYEKEDEFPFDYTRKIASVLLKRDEKHLLIAKGGVDDVLRHCSYASYRGETIPFDGQSRASVYAVVDEMHRDGMKVLAIAQRELDHSELRPEDEKELTLIGYVAFFDAPKKSARSAMEKLNRLHVGTKVLTGDSADVAVSVCRRLGMDVRKIMTGKEFDLLSDNEIQIRIEETVIFAELSPSQKAEIVGILQSNSHTVGFLADGMNDLAAVLKSDVGICVDTAVSSVKECADVILLKKDLNVLESGITEGRRAFANMKKYVKITSSSNLGNIIAIVFAGIFLPFFPMTSVQILLLNLLYDILCLVMPWDNVDDEMVQTPMEWSGKTLSGFMLVFGCVSSVFDILTFLFLFKVLCPYVCGAAYSALSVQAQAEFVSVFQTGWFLESMWTQILILHLLRTERLAFVKSRSSIPVSVVTAVGIIVYTLAAVTPIGEFAGLSALPAGYYIFLITVVTAYLMVVSAVKKIYKRYHTALI